MDFPQIRVIDGQVTFDGVSARTIARIQSDCINLKTIRVDPESARDMELHLDRFVDFKNFTRALSLIDTRLREFPNLNWIIVNVYEHKTSDFFKEKMELLGWVIFTVASEDSDDEFYDEDYGEDYWKDLMREVGPYYLQ